ncbi:hypothetical protein ACEPPN_008819 [Leptodophora sp. 'Broadleaf-Isolate-01']
MPHRIETPDWESASVSSAAEIHTPNTNDLARIETLSSGSSMPELIDPSQRGGRSSSSPLDTYQQLEAERQYTIRWNRVSSTDGTVTGIIGRRASESDHVDDGDAIIRDNWIRDGSNYWTIPDANASRNDANNGYDDGRTTDDNASRDGTDDNYDDARITDANASGDDTDDSYDGGRVTDVNTSGDDADDEAPTPPGQAHGPHPTRFLAGTTIEDMRQHMARHVMFGDAEDWHRLYWNTDYGVPAPGQGQPQPQSQAQRPSRPGLVRGMAYTPQMVEEPADADNMNVRAVLEEFINTNGIFLESDFRTAIGPEFDASIVNYGEPTMPISTNLTANDAQSPDQLSTFDQEMKDKYVSLCEEYGSILQKHCRSLWWRIEDCTVSHTENFPSIPQLSLLRDIGIDMLSKDPNKLGQAAIIYSSIMQAYKQRLSFHAELGARTEDQIEIPMLGEFCQLLESSPFLHVGFTWRVCIKLHTGYETSEILDMRELENLEK